MRCCLQAVTCQGLTQWHFGLTRACALPCFVLRRVHQRVVCGWPLRHARPAVQLAASPLPGSAGACARAVASHAQLCPLLRHA
jgi:hypothetical protein